MTDNIYKDVKHIVYVSTNIGESCKHCSEYIGLEHFAESVNHYIKEHGYKLLHIGMETGTDNNGKPFQSTVSVLGK